MQARAALCLAARFACVVACIALCLPAAANDSRYDLAVQQQYTSNIGFVLLLENVTPDPGPCPLKTLKLTLGVGDGSAWHYCGATPKWKLGHEYRIDVTITNTDSTLSVDGVQMAKSSGSFVPYRAGVFGNVLTQYSRGATVYIVREKYLRLSTPGQPDRTLSFADAYNEPATQYAFTRNAPDRVDGWVPALGRTVNIEAVFRLEPNPDLSKLAPLIDAYGQPIRASWPTKIHTDADLRAAIAPESRWLASHPLPRAFDQYGGDTKLGWRIAATGYFTLTRRNGAWWLVDPDGYPCFYNCVCSVCGNDDGGTPVTGRQNLFAWLPPNSGQFHDAWTPNVWNADKAVYFGFINANLIRKYGANWKAREWATNMARLRSWGFSGAGKWSVHHPGMVDVVVLFHFQVPTLAGHPDVFDPAVRAALRQALAMQMASRVTDKSLLGWSVGNERSEAIFPNEITQILQDARDVPAKRAFVDYALANIYVGNVDNMAAAWKVMAASVDDLYAARPNPPAADIETLRRFYAGRYYACLYKTVKSIDPHHLFFGEWLEPYWGWQNDSDWDLEAANADVTGFDFYADSLSDPNLLRWMRRNDKPVFCGEYSFAPAYHGGRGLGTYGVWSTDEADAGRMYARWMGQSVHNPYIVGLSWFEYRDEPVTGRGPGFGPALDYDENYAFGLVDDTDQPKWPLIEQVRTANLGAAVARQRAFSK